MSVTESQPRVDDGVSSGLSNPMEKHLHRRPLVWIAAVAAVVVTATAAIWFFVAGDDRVEPVAGVAVRFGEAAVVDLFETEDYDGTLGRSAGDPIVAVRGGTVTATAAEGDTLSAGDVAFAVDGEPAVIMLGPVPAWRDMGMDVELDAIANYKSGVITGIGVAEGETIAEGDVLYSVAAEPVVLLYGDVPAYRTLRRNVEGADVLQLEEALVRLGFDPDGRVTVDEEFTSATEDMVESWEESIGAVVDGRVDFGDVVFLPGPTVVESVNLAVGAQATQPVLSVEAGRTPIEGVDVEQLEANLEDLGYSPGPVDGSFDAATQAAVELWQAAVGAEVDGIVHRGEVIFVEFPVRIIDVLAAPGSTAPGPVLATSSADITVAVALPAADQGVVGAGDTVTVELPDGRRTSATVSSVGTIATQGQGGATFEVVVVLDDPAVAAGLDEAPVDVQVVTDSRQGVLAVPVTALVALREGGYAVEVQRGSGTTLVAVEPGFYASGLVEILSGDLAAGDRVVVP